ncbi:ABC transporter ATP-binding protein [Oceanicella sp. SM1341]|uniref:ABC transporter ATP-binding protein n=1 Tax=Oceanicella sp. SM1341 TaxID=1548889 RepID=UPI000E490A98|nr:ABC transporter ATP-binding protein [Oceanicella sp. SM1341]
MSSLLEIAGLDAGYGEVGVLHAVSLSVPEGGITAVIGSNGAGKTTLMRAASGLVAPRAGSIRFAGSEVGALPAHRRVELGLALVPEGRMVFPELTVHETLTIGGYARRARAGAAARIDEMYALFPRLAERRHAQGGALSGGEQQMLALARGLMSRPRLLLLDEPSLGLSPVMAEEVMDAVLRIREAGTTICLVEQNVYSALAVADRAYVMEEGRVVKSGTGAALLTDDSIRESYLGM